MKNFIICTGRLNSGFQNNFNKVGKYSFLQSFIKVKNEKITIKSFVRSCILVLNNENCWLEAVLKSKLATFSHSSEVIFNCKRMKLACVSIFITQNKIILLAFLQR